MKYLLFAGHDEYRDGGWFDYKGSYSSVEEAVKRGQELIADKDEDEQYHIHWWHVINIETKAMAAVYPELPILGLDL